MIYHLVTLKGWEKYLHNLGQDFKSPSLKTEGFIHCSEKSQLLESAQLHFEGEDELVVLFLVEKRLKGILKREPSRNGELFPHIYGPIPVGAIETTKNLVRNKEGVFEFESW